MIFSLKITPKAESDLIETWMCTFETWGTAQADEYVDQLGEGMAHLTAHPSLGADYSHVLSGCRKFRIAHHDVFYRVLEMEIFVIRAIHEDMDAPRRLLE